MFIPIEHLEEEIFPAAYLIVLSSDINLKKNSDTLKFEAEKCSDSESKIASSEENQHKIIKKFFRAICRSNNFDLRVIKIIGKQILLVISIRSNAKSKIVSNKNEIDFQMFSQEIWVESRESVKLEKIYRLWTKPQIESAIDFIEKEMLKVGS